MKKDELLFNSIGFIEESRNALNDNIEAIHNICTDYFMFATPSERYNKNYMLIRNNLILIYKAMCFDKSSLEQYLEILNKENEQKK